MYNKKNKLEGTSAIPLKFFLFHFNSEKGHGDNVLDELHESFSNPDFDGKKFIEAGVNALTATWAKELGVFGIRFVSVSPDQKRDRSYLQ